MMKFKGCRVQKISRQGDHAGASFDLCWRPIHAIADDGVAKGGKVDAYLMSAPGIDLYFQQGELSE